MSRVANNPISIPEGVEVAVNGNLVDVKGPKGQLQHQVHELVGIKKAEDGTLQVEYDNNVTVGSGSKNIVKSNIVALAGTTRSIVNNYIIGVSKGFERKLLMVGVGYRAQAQGSKLNISAGFSHPVEFSIPEGITIETPTQTEILIKGINKQLVGQVAANIRAVRPPEPYKGKGIRYEGETISLKETKKK